MRVDPADSVLTSLEREPRHVVGIVFPTSSPYFTSKAGMSNVPGVPVQGTIQSISGVSQRIVPREGRSTIGGITVTLVDAAGVVTSEIRSQLTSGNGIRGREVRVFTGDSDDYNDLTRVETFIVDDVMVDKGTYRIECVDRKREMRADIFEPKTTQLTASITDSATTISASDTSDFELVTHTASFSDAPSSTVGYGRFKKTGEIFRYTGKTANSFTGVTRGVLGTIAQAITIDGGTPTEKLPIIEEVIYYEMPGPQLLYTVLTGTILGTANTIPAHHNLGIATAAIASSDFNNVGLDLFDPSDYTAGAIFRFVSPGKTDGKRFCETELLLPMGCFQPIGATGVLGLRRLPRILEDAPEIATLDHSNVVTISGLRHNQQAMANQIRIDWNYNGERFTRTSLYVDGASISTHGKAPPRVFKFKGLSVVRTTEQVLQNLARIYLDRSSEPPIELSLTCLPSVNHIEVGDVVRVTLPDTQDYAGTGTLDRSFLVEERYVDWTTGNVRLRLFGSSLEASPVSPTADTSPIPDGWYDDAGTELSTVLTIVGGAVTANGSLTGNADMNAAGAIYYYLGNLTINSGVTVSIANNVQLRVRGFLTINGAISGAGTGLAGVADPNTVGLAPQVFPEEGTAGFIGTTRPQGGIYFDGLNNAFPRRVGTARGIHDAFPYLNISLTDTATTPALNGIPGDLRGSSGGPGGYLSQASGGEKVEFKGPTGGDGGAGLAIVCRGLGFGASGEIDLSGDDGGIPSSHTGHGVTVYEGAGAGGAPGGLLVLLDGSAVAVPDLTGGNFVANRGASPWQGTLGQFISGGRLEFPTQPGSNPNIGLPAADLSRAHQRIQYVPGDFATGDSDDEVVPAPTNLAAAVDGAGVLLSWVNPAAGTFDYVEIYEATSNDRTGAVKIAQRVADTYFRGSDVELTRYYWVRAVDESIGVSEWEPQSSTAGVSATFGGAVGPPGADAVEGSVVADAPLSWLRGTDQVTWTPAGTTVDLDATFTQGGVDVARIARRVTRDADGLLTVTTTAHTGGDLNTGDVTVSVDGSGTRVVTVEFAYSLAGAAHTMSETVVAVLSGAAGTTGQDGQPGRNTLNADPDFLTFDLATTYWFSDRAATLPLTDVANWSLAAVTDGLVGGYVLRRNSATGDIGYSEWVPIDPNETYYVSIWARAAASREVQLGVTFFDSSGTVIHSGTSDATGWASIDNTHWATGFQTLTSSWLKLSDTFGPVGAATIPTGAAYCSLAIYVNPNNEAAANIDLQQFQLLRRDKVSVAQGGVGIVTSLPSLPDVQYPTGSLVYLTTDGKLYRNVSGTWTRTIPASDLSTNLNLSTQVTGTLSTAFAAAGLINANVTINNDGTLSGAGGGQASLTNLPGTIAAGQIAANAVTTVKLDALAVTAAKIAALAVETDKLAANAVTAAKIAANTITAAEIASNTITANEILAGTITVAELAATLTYTKEIVISTGGKIRQGKTSAASTTAGFWLGTDGASAYDFHIGDSSFSLWWDASAGTLKIVGDLQWNAVQSFTPSSWTGFSTPPTGTMEYLNMGTWAMLWAPAQRSGTSGGGSATSLVMNGLPAAITPSSTANIGGLPIIDNSVAQYGKASVNPAGTVSFQPYSVVSGDVRTTTWGTTLTKGLQSGCIMIYPL